MDYIERTLGQNKFKWNYRGLSENPNLTTIFLERHLNENWNWQSVSANGSIPLKYIERTLGQDGYRWDYQGLSSNPNLTTEFLRKHLKANWNW